MGEVQLRGRFTFKTPKGVQSGLAAFDARRYVELISRDDLTIEKLAVSADVTKEVEEDCLDHFHDAFVAMAELAVGGVIEVAASKRRVQRVYAGKSSFKHGHVVSHPRHERGRLDEITGVRLEHSEKSFFPYGFQTARVSPDKKSIAVTGGGRGAVGGAGTLPKYFKASLKTTNPKDSAPVLFDLETGEERMRYFGPRWVVGALDFSPDGRLLAAGCADELLYVWDVASGALVKKLSAHKNGVTAVRWASDGSSLFTGGPDLMVRVWSWPSLEPASQKACKELPRSFDATGNPAADPVGPEGWKLSPDRLTRG